MQTSKNILSIAISVLFITSCQNDNNTSDDVQGSTDLTYVPNKDRKLSFIKPPILGKEIAFENFTIDAQKDEEITTENGTKITIYKNSLVDQDGNVVSGKVEINYRDYHNPLEVYLSGIPMNYDSAGVEYVFETAGMFELKASQDGKEISLKQDGKIDLDFISTSNEQDFNFYEFDEAKGEWIVESKEIKTKTLLNSNSGKTALIKPIAQNKNNYAFDMELDKSTYPELSQYEGTMFEVKEGEAFNSMYYNVQWDNAEVKKLSGNNYQLTLIKEDTSILVKVKPVVATNQYKKAMNKYNNQMAENKKKQENRSEFDVYSTSTIAYNTSMSAQSIIIREFTLNGFGIYNLDKPGIMQPNGEVKTLLVNRNDEEQKLDKLSYTVVNLNRNAIVNLFGKPKYYKGALTVVWSILNENEMIIIYPEQFRTMQDRKLITSTYSIDEGISLLDDIIANR